MYVNESFRGIWFSSYTRDGTVQMWQSTLIDCVLMQWRRAARQRQGFHWTVERKHYRPSPWTPKPWKMKVFPPPIYGLQPLKMKVVGSHGIIIYTFGLPLTCSSCRDSPFKYFQFSLGAKKIPTLPFGTAGQLGGQFSIYPHMYNDKNLPACSRDDDSYCLGHILVVWWFRKSGFNQFESWKKELSLAFFVGWIFIW